MLYVDENSAKGTVVGTLTSNDPETSQTHTYKLIKSPGNIFAVNGEKLKVCCPCSVLITLAHRRRILDLVEGAHLPKRAWLCKQG